MITIDDAIQWVTEEYTHLIFGESEFVGDERAYEAVMTILSTLEYSKLLENKFGSLEEALEAEKVTHCWECNMWNPEKSICNKPYESMRARCPHEYCSDGRYYRLTGEKLNERLAKISEKFNFKRAKEDSE